MGFNKTELQQIAKHLQARNPGKDVALAHLPAGNDVYYALHDSDKVLFPSSAIVELIQALNQKGTRGYRDRVLRDGNRVYYTAAPNGMDLAMARMNGIALEKLGGKPLPEDWEPPLRGTYIHAQSDRWGFSSPLSSFAVGTAGPAPSLTFGGGKEAGTHTIDRLYMMTVFSLVASRFIRRFGSHEDANIGAILVSPVGNILAWSTNTKEHNSTYHAEVNLLQGYFRNAVNPAVDGTRLYTTLKPCRMCAGMIHHVGGGAITVICGQGDPGPDAQDTDLDGTGMLHRLDGSTLGAKAAMAVLSTGIGTEKVDLLAELEAEREVRRGMQIATMLESRRSRELMRGAIRTMSGKLAKYASPGGNDNVRRALGHIEPFLTAHGAHPRQVQDISNYLYGNPDALGTEDTL